MQFIVGRFDRKGWIRDCQMADSYLQAPISLPGGQDRIARFAPGGSAPALAFDDNRVRFSIPGQDHLYLSTKEDASFSSPPRTNQFCLKPGVYYSLDGEIQIESGQASLWIVEYDQSGRLCHQTLKLASGSFELNWTTHPKHDSCCLALRLSGAGSLAISGLKIRENPSSGKEIDVFSRFWRQEYVNQSFDGLNERPVEYRFVFHVLSRLKSEQHRILDVGAGKTALPALMRNCGFVVTASDNIEDYWADGMFNPHWHVLHDNIVDSKIGGEFDLITCISVLEHIQDYHAAVRNMFALLKPGGRLVLTFFYNERQFIENIYDRPEIWEEFKNRPYLGRVFSRKEIDEWRASNRADVIEQEYWQMNEGDLPLEGKPLDVLRQTGRDEKHHLTCLLLEKK
jgi:SAM-dependent methyltransferase